MLLVETLLEETVNGEEVGLAWSSLHNYFNNYSNGEQCKIESINQNKKNCIDIDQLMLN